MNISALDTYYSQIHTQFSHMIINFFIFLSLFIFLYEVLLLLLNKPFPRDVNIYEYIQQIMKGKVNTKSYNENRVTMKIEFNSTGRKNK